MPAASNERQCALAESPLGFGRCFHRSGSTNHNLANDVRVRRFVHNGVESDQEHRRIARVLKRVRNAWRNREFVGLAARYFEIANLAPLPASEQGGADNHAYLCAHAVIVISANAPWLGQYDMYVPLLGQIIWA
jgi:hypothetical protein